MQNRKLQISILAFMAATTSFVCMAASTGFEDATTEEVAKAVQNYRVMLRCMDLASPRSKSKMGVSSQEVSAELEKLQIELKCRTKKTVVSHGYTASAPAALSKEADLKKEVKVQKELLHARLVQSLANPELEAISKELDATPLKSSLFKKPAPKPFLDRVCNDLEIMAEDTKSTLAGTAEMVRDAAVDAGTTVTLAVTTLSKAMAKEITEGFRDLNTVISDAFKNSPAQKPRATEAFYILADIADISFSDPEKAKRMISAQRSNLFRALDKETASELVGKMNALISTVRRSKDKDNIEQLIEIQETIVRKLLGDKNGNRVITHIQRLEKTLNDSDSPEDVLREVGGVTQEILAGLIGERKPVGLLRTVGNLLY